jgi:nucleoside-diphosphate kinase
MERTLILLKPDAVQRRLCGRLLTRFEDKGLRIVGMKLLQVTVELSQRHYAEHVEKPFYPLLEEFITAAPVLAIVAEGPGAIEVVRRMLGPTHGGEAPPGTIRGDFGASRQMNLVHGSDGPEAAAREIEIYFKPEELIDYEPTLGGWVCAEDEK